MRYRLGSRYHTSFFDSNGTLALTINRLYAVPFMTADAKTITRIAIHVTTLGTAAHARLGIYQDNGSIYPGSRVSDCGVVDCSTTGMKEITGHFRVLNLYVDKDSGKLVVEYDDTPVIIKGG
jgi:hypothetical protein